MFPFTEPEFIWNTSRRELQSRLLPSLKRFVMLQSMNRDDDERISRGTGGRA
jgi:hypothetical protein